MRHIWNKFIIAFINGIAIILPVFITVALIRFFVNGLNNLILEPIMGFISPLVSGPVHVYISKTAIFVTVILLVALMGWGVKVIFIKRLFAFGESLLLKLPVMGKVYNGLKQIFSAFLGQGKTVFRQVALIEYPRKGLYSVGFTTGDVKGVVSKELHKEAYNVFVPTTPNPTSGVYLLVPKENLKILDMTVEEGMKMVISGGSVSPLFTEGMIKEELKN